MSRMSRRRAKIWNEKICPMIEAAAEFIGLAFLFFSMIVVSVVLLCAF